MKAKNITTTFLLLFILLHIHAQRVTIDFEEYATGITLSNQLSLSSLGISFTNGLEVVDCQFDNGLCDAGADGANSGNKVGLASYSTEFTRNPIIIRFEDRQDSVTFYLKPAYDNLQMQVSIEGWADGLDIPISGGTANFDDNNFIRYKLTSCDEVRLYAQTTGSSSYDNWLIIDDITFNVAEDVPEDNTDPYVFFSQPIADYESENGIIPLSGLANDNVQLDTVEVFVYQGDDVIYQNNFCGRAGVPCPIGTENYEFETTLDLSSNDNGEYLLQVRAVDVSGNEDTYSRTFTLNIPDPPPGISVHKIEINQAVHDQLFEVDGPGAVSTANSSVPLLPERNTLVRYYLKTEEGVRYDYHGELKLTVFYEDGSNASYFITPNLTGLPEVDSILPMPAESMAELEQLVGMRANLSKTLNFVISEDLLIDADIIGLTLFEGITPVSGQLQMSLWPPVELGINYYKVKADTPDSAVFMNNIGNYIDGTYPVSRLHQKYEGEIIIRLGFDLIAEIAGFSDASRYRRSLGSAINGRWPALPYTPEYNHWRVILGVMDPFAGGNATLGNANNDNDRLYGVASTSSRGNVGAHETGHLIGLSHAGRAHGECGGGGCETFVNTNGTLDGDNALYGDFGIALRYSDMTSTYDAFLIDPCPVSNVSDRIGGCTAGVLDSDSEPVRPFDMMSYGEPPTWGGFLLDTRSRQWISTHNYRRIYFAIQNRTDIKSGIVTKNVMDDKKEQETDVYFQIDGIIKNDSAYLYSIVEKQLQENVYDITDDETGNYRIIINNGEGMQLLEKSFEPDSVQDTDECCPLSFSVIVPKVEGANELHIENPDGETILQKTASINKPTINLLSDLGGNNYTDGTINLTWDATDADNDQLIILAEYSPDMGDTWIPLAYLEEPEENQISVDVKYLRQSNNGVIKLSVSDGFHTSVDINSETFCVNAEGNCSATPVNFEDVGLVSIQEISNKQEVEVRVYPNPADRFVQVNLDTKSAGKLNIQLYDLIGKSLGLVVSDYNITPGRNSVTIETDDLTKGIYTMHIEFNNQVFTKRLIVTP